MKIFTCRDEHGWSHSINFVDSLNVALGYDYDQSCCEDFGFSIHRLEGDDIKYTDPCLCDGNNMVTDTNYIFDTNYYVETGDGDGGNIGRFRLFDPDAPKDEIFLTLWNYHNGYYSHDFELKAGETNIRSGSL